MAKKYCLTLEKEPIPERRAQLHHFNIWRVRVSPYTLVRCPAGNIIFSEDINALEETTNDYFLEHTAVSFLYAREYLGRFRLYDLENYGRYNIGTEIVRVFSVTDRKAKVL